MKQNLYFQKNLSSFESNIWENSDLKPEDFDKMGLTGFIGYPKTKLIRISFPDRNIPRNVNYTAQGLVTKVYFQGYCGSCW